MDDPGTLAIIGRLAVAVFVMVAPTLLFLGLIRGLERLRDDAFIDRWLREQDHDLEDDVTAVFARGIGLEAGSDPASSGRCPACGASNSSSATYCRNCLGRLSS